MVQDARVQDHVEAAKPREVNRPEIRQREFYVVQTKIPLDEEASLIVGGATFDGDDRRPCAGQLKRMPSLKCSQL